MELSTSMRESVSSLGYYRILSECTSVSVDLYSMYPSFLRDGQDINSMLVHLPIHEISVSNFTANFLVPPAAIIRSGVARYMRISFAPYGYINGTVGNHSSDLNTPTINLITGNTFTISSFSLTFPREGRDNNESFSRRLPVITGIKITKTERPENRFSPAPDYIDLFW